MYPTPLVCLYLLFRNFYYLLYFLANYLKRLLKSSQMIKNAIKLCDNQLYFNVQIGTVNVINIINTKKMIFPLGEVKIEQESPQLPPQCLKEEASVRDRPGNSRIFAKTGHWREQEKLSYLLFIDFHAGKFITKQKRKLQRVFRAMSAFVRTRKPMQCRTHHQKMESYFQSHSAVIQYFKSKTPGYAEHYQRSLSKLRAIDFGLHPLVKSDQFLEESIPNNELLPLKSRISRKESRRSSNTSIRLEDDAQKNEVTDKELPKTDHSLNNFPSIKDEQTQMGRKRTSLDFGVFHNQTVLYPTLAYLFFVPTFPFFSMEKQQHKEQRNKTVPSFFEYYQILCRDDDEVWEWRECERLYRDWRDSVQALIHSNQ